MTIVEDKAALRRRIRSWRKGLDPASCASASERVCESLIALDEAEGARTLALYDALPGEIDVGPLAEWAWARGQTVALPRVLGPGRMGFFRFATPTELVRSGLGLREPGPNATRVETAALELVVLPGLSFDRDGFRLGFGQGYYDRALAQCPHAFRIGVAFEAQLVERIPREPHDLPVHAVVTERRVIRV